MFGDGSSNIFMRINISDIPEQHEFEDTVMECVSPISLVPFLGTHEKTAVFFCPDTIRCEDGIATYWGRASGGGCLRSRFLEDQHPE